MHANDALVAGAACDGLGATQAPGVKAELIAALRRHTFREVIARGALAGLGHLGELSLVGTLESHAKYGVDEAERPDAIAALGAVGKKHPSAVLGFLEHLALHDPYFRARRAAVAALGRMGSPNALNTLRSVGKRDAEAGLRNAAYDATADIRDAATEKTKKFHSRRGHQPTEHEQKRTL